MTPQPPSHESQYHLLRRFGFASLAVIAAIAIANALLLSDFLTRRMLDREAHVTMDFVQNILLADGSIGYLSAPQDQQLKKRFEGSIEHFSAMPDVLLINIYARDGTVLWSSNSQIIGHRFDHNEELDEALKGQLVVHGGRITDEQRSKPEHIGLPHASEFFIETYIPVQASGGGLVPGVVEIYKAPLALTAAITDGHHHVWITALGGAIVLYLTLFWIVRRADRTIRRQHDRLLETEALAVVGELASAVAHNIRNPLASIRSSAELTLEMKGENYSVQAQDISAAVDRIESWVRDLLRFAIDESGAHATVDAAPLLQKCFADCSREFESRGITARVDVVPSSARVSADATLLGHLLHSLVANAIDATPAGGRITGRLATVSNGRVSISITDSGRGIAPEHLEQVFRPFFTSKKQGLGLGLPLVRRAMERFGGQVRVESTPGCGTTFTLEFLGA